MLLGGRGGITIFAEFLDNPLSLRFRLYENMAGVNFLGSGLLRDTLLIFCL